MMMHSRRWSRTLKLVGSSLRTNRSGFAGRLVFNSSTLTPHSSLSSKKFFKLTHLIPTFSQESLIICPFLQRGATTLTKQPGLPHNVLDGEAGGSLDGD